MIEVTSEIVDSECLQIFVFRYDRGNEVLRVVSKVAAGSKRTKGDWEADSP